MRSLRRPPQPCPARGCLRSLARSVELPASVGEPCGDSVRQRLHWMLDNSGSLSSGSSPGPSQPPSPSPEGSAEGSAEGTEVLGLPLSSSSGSGSEAPAEEVMETTPPAPVAARSRRRRRPVLHTPPADEGDWTEVTKKRRQPAEQKNTPEKAVLHKELTPRPRPQPANVADAGAERRRCSILSAVSSALLAVAAESAANREPQSEGCSLSAEEPVSWADDLDESLLASPAAPPMYYHAPPAQPPQNMLSPNQSYSGCPTDSIGQSAVSVDAWSVCDTNSVPWQGSAGPSPPAQQQWVLGYDGVWHAPWETVAPAPPPPAFGGWSIPPPRDPVVEEAMDTLRASVSILHHARSRFQSHGSGESAVALSTATCRLWEAAGHLRRCLSTDSPLAPVAFAALAEAEESLRWNPSAVPPTAVPASTVPIPQPSAEPMVPCSTVAVSPT